MEKTFAAIAWTACDDELPDDDLIVLVAIDSDSDPVWIGSYDSQEQHWYTPEHATISVTHWAEMPESPVPNVA